MDPKKVTMRLDYISKHVNCFKFNSFESVMRSQVIMFRRRKNENLQLGFFFFKK